MKKGFVLIPGAGMSDWLWTRLVPELRFPSVSISRRLRVNDREGRLHATFRDLIDYAEENIENSGFDEVVLVGHSGAGLLAGTLGKTSKRVRHVVFIAANIPAHGTTAVDIFPDELREKNIAAVTGQADFDSIPVKNFGAMFAEVFCNACTAEERDYVLAQNFYPEPVCVLTERMDWSAYPDVGLTYILCTQDRTLSADGQAKLAANLNITDIRKIDGDPLVMISRPAALAAELNEIAERY